MSDIAQALWEAPFGLLAHDLPEPGTEEGQPLFSYANKAALELFEAEWGELVGQPSSISADADAQVGPVLPAKLVWDQQIGRNGLAESSWQW